MVRVDASGSPARLLKRSQLEARHGWAPTANWTRARDGPDACAYDAALRWLTVTDQKVSGELARALVEVRDGRLFEREGHARWSIYVRAFVGRTQRWTQYEMRRERALQRLPRLAGAFRSGALGKSHLRVFLSLVTPETEEAWLQRGLSMTVRQLEELARREGRPEEGGAAATDDGVAGRGDAADAAAATGGEEAEAAARPVRHVVTAPPGVAALVGEAVELARRVAGYQVGAGEAVAMMAAETVSGLPRDCGPADAGSAAEDGAAADDGAATEIGAAARAGPPRARGPTDGSHDDLVAELGRGWPDAHRSMEDLSGRWAALPWDLPQVVFEAAPSPDDGAHRRVVFWAAAQGRLDAVRGRLLRIMEDSPHARHLDFAGLGQYVRERLGMSLREARELIDLDRALSGLTAAFRAYAAGHLSRSAAWLVARAATTSRGDQAWTRYALTHTLRALEAAVEAARIGAAATPGAWRPDGLMPPGDVSFAGLTRMCSHPDRDNAVDGDGRGDDARGEGARGDEAAPPRPVARIRLLFDEAGLAAYRQALAALRLRYGPDRPEWWCLAVMARHFIDVHATADGAARPSPARRIVQRDNYTCVAAECLQRGGLEAHHIRPRSAGGPDTPENQTSLCAAHHRRIRHEVGSLVLYGEAPDGLKVRMGGRLYVNDRLAGAPADSIDVDPWRVSEGGSVTWGRPA